MNALRLFVFACAFCSTVAAQDSEWTTETLRADLLARMEANDRRYTERFDAGQKALEIGLAAQKEAVDAAFAAQAAAVAAALSSADRAVQKAETAAEKRFESVNEFRSTLADQQRSLMPRAEVAVMFEALDQKVDALQKQIDRIEASKQGESVGWAWFVGVLGVVVIIAAAASAFLRSLSRPKTD